MAKKITEEEFEKTLDGAIQDATAWQEQNLGYDRQRNYEYYTGKMKPAPAGRSQATSWDTFETVESALPDLVEIFLSNDNIAEYEPVGEEDEKYCEQATDYINYIVQKQNPGFLIFNTWIKDALLSKVGIVRAYWAKTKKVTVREYTGIDEDQLTQLLDGEGVEVLEQDSYSDPQDLKARAEARKVLNTLDINTRMQVQAALDAPPTKLYDVKIKRTVEKGRVYIDNVQPENFIITPRAKTVAASDLVGEFKSMTRSDMREAGYKESDLEDVRSFNNIVLDSDGLAQIMDNDSAANAFADQMPNDDATEDIFVFDGFIRLDYDGDGLAEWRHVVRAGNITLLNESADGPDFVTMSPILIPHRLIGMALADTVAPIQEMSTAMQRQYVDSLMLANNPRTYAIENQVNMDDLLNNRIGGVVRIKSAGAVGPLITANVAQSALEGIEFMDSRRELRTGITRYNQGLDADSLNKTATGVSKIMSAGDRRKVMMARIMAETGIKDLFKLLLKIVTDNQDQAATVRLRNEWVAVDPSPWSQDMDVTIETGLGTGDKSEIMAILQMILQTQKEAMMNELPIVDLSNMYNTMEAMLKTVGMKGINKYFKNPADPKNQQQQQKPPEPTPEQAIAQATVQAEQIKAEVAMKRIEADIALKSKDLEIKQVELQIKMAELQLRKEQAISDAELARAKATHAAQTANRQEDRKDIEILGKATGVI